MVIRNSVERGRRRRLLLVFLAGALALPSAIAADPLSISRWTVDGGGSGLVPTGPWTLGGTIGQPDAGRLVGSGFSISGGFWVTGYSTTGVEDPSDPLVETIPREARIHRAAPNPLVGRTMIAFDLPEAREVEVRIFDVTGALVRILKSETLPAGRHALPWDVSDSHGRRVGAGLYLVRVRLGALERSQKLVVLR